LVFMDEDIAPGLAWRPPARRGGGSCCRKVSSDPLDLAAAPDSRRSLPSLSALLLSEPCIDIPTIKATCKARGVNLNNGFSALQG
jgi:hypothetical protein